MSQDRSSVFQTRSELLQPAPAAIEKATERIHEEIQKLRLEEFTVHNNIPELNTSSFWAFRHSWVLQSIANVKHYIKFLFITWFNVLKCVLYGGKGFFSVFMFAFASSIILVFTWVWCFIATAPLVVYLYQTSYFGRSSGGLGLVNASNPHIFNSLSKRQCEAAKEQLVEPPKPELRNTKVFSLDIARLLLQIASLMYERDEKMPKLIRLIKKQLGDNSITSRSNDISPADVEPGHFARRLFGANYDEAVLATAKNHIAASETILNWTLEHGIEYEPVSELASLSQAYCSLFWDPASTWVVVAFKGTDPRSFEEWTTDFSADMVSAAEDIPGFANVHRGFKERLFPDVREGHRQPWEYIAAGIKVVTDGLAEIHGPETKCDVWFTGHSLGTALATMAYARALKTQAEIGEHARLRDAYLFATPITTDVPSRDAFEEALNSDPKVPRNMWRVTNRDDFVATGLPSLGDDRKLKIPANNPAGFAHLGTEIFLKSFPRPCEVATQSVAKGVQVRIESKFSPEEVVQQRQMGIACGMNVKWVYLALQYIPIVGRMAAHANTNYYDQLEQVALKRCVHRG
ncbi:hypothetical protein FRB99_000093 [Tulasnella sp. 403]|nr:hypothetical protein FRB99_000093 [Tulasnella sp. 403]